MRENRVESKFVKEVKDAGGKAYKFTSPGRRHVPDRLVLFPIPRALRAVLAKFMWFAEIKAPGKKPRPGQVREIERLRKMGYRVDIIDGGENEIQNR